MLSFLFALLLSCHAFLTVAAPNDWDRYKEARKLESARSTPSLEERQLVNNPLPTNLNAADLKLFQLYTELLGNGGNDTGPPSFSNISRSLSTLRHNGQSLSFQYGPDTFDIDASQCSLGLGINIGSWTFSDGTTQDNVTLHNVLQDVSQVKTATGASSGVNILLDQAVATLDGAIDDMQGWYDQNVCLFGAGSMTAEVANLTNGMRTLNSVEGNHWTLSIATAAAAGVTVWGAQEIAHGHPDFRQAANAVSGFVPVMASALIYFVGRNPRAPNPILNADAVAVAVTAASVRRSSRGIKSAPRACFAAVVQAINQCFGGGGQVTPAQEGNLIPAFPADVDPVGGGSYCVPGGDLEMGGLSIGSASIPALGVVDAAAVAASYATDNAQQFCLDPYAT